MCRNIKTTILLMTSASLFLVFTSIPPEKGFGAQFSWPSTQDRRLETLQSLDNGGGAEQGAIESNVGRTIDGLFSNPVLRTRLQPQRLNHRRVSGLPAHGRKPMPSTLRVVIDPADEMKNVMAAPRIPNSQMIHRSGETGKTRLP